MNVNLFLRKTGIVSIIESIAIIFVGIVLVIKAEVAVKVIAAIIGGLIILFGIFEIIDYFRTRKVNFEGMNYSLIIGLMAIVLGIVTIYYSVTIETFLRFIIGVWIIYGSLVKLNFSIRMKSIEANGWKICLLFSIVMFGLGLFVLFNIGAFISIIGIIMIVESVLEIIDDLIFIKNIKELI